jgi:methyl-accepting chemotaxis protein
MKWFANRKISSKLFMGFGVVLVVAIAVGVVGIVNIQSVATNSTVMYKNMTVPIAELTNVVTAFERTRVNLRDMVLYTDATKIAEAQQSTEERRAEADASLEKFSALIISDKVREAYNDLLEARTQYREYADKITTLVNDRKGIEADLLIKSDAFIAVEQAYQDCILKLVEMKREDADEKESANTSLANDSVMTTMAVLVAGALLAILIAIYISRLISGSMKKIIFAADRIAEGDLTAEIDIETKDEIGELARAFKKMSDNLDEVLTGINAASEQVSSGAGQLSESSAALSQGASEQASSIEELTASLEQISSQTQLNAQNASQANKLASAAQTNAQQGNEQMREMLSAMEGINESSANISKIIKVIDDIAFQTNILALNAAVEAARAGQHGKGFAVVAEEVRNLAAKSANAAKETTDLIEGSIRKVEAGTKLATNTAEALEKIVEGVAQAAALVNQIDVASNEQAAGLAQINQAVMQVSQVVQANSAVSEQSAAASKELAGQAEMMRESVRRFTLKSAKVHGRSKPMAAEAPAEDKPAKADVRPARAAGKPAIVLSDDDFGKY